MKDILDRENSRIKEGLSVTWKDLVRINDKVYSEEFPISGEVDIFDDDDICFRIDDFLAAVAEKYGCEPDDILTYTMDEYFDEGADLPEGFYRSDAVAFGAEECGAYIDGVPYDDLLLG